MEANESYWQQGYVVMPGLLPVDRGKAFVEQVMQGALTGEVALAAREMSPVLQRTTFQLNSSHYAPLRTLHAELTPVVAAIVGLDLAPTYGLFRIYGRGDICRVHGDAPACEHSASVMLGVEGGEPWALDIATDATPRGFGRVEQDFGDAGYVAAAMTPGDAILYQGVTRRHGRTTPNPNSWSAHLFLHWVARDGPYATLAAPESAAA